MQHNTENVHSEGASSTAEALAAMAASLRKLWEALRGVDRRQLQFEIDVHRLFLLTRYNKVGAASPTDVDEITELGNRLSFDEQKKAVQDYVHEQIARVSAAMDDILLVEPRQKKPDISTATKGTKRPSGLSFAVGQAAPKIEPEETSVPIKTRPLKLLEVSAALKDSIGYTLELKPSQIDHKEAGQGVYLAGKVGPGTVVSLYPGIIYSPSQYRFMPGYPRMDITNSYLISRYDGLIIDGQPWGIGGENRELWNGGCQNERVRDQQIDASSQMDATKPKAELALRDTKTKSAGLWSALCGARETSSARKASILERRNPLALAHIVNHPTQGKQPNVMLCPYDFVASEPNIRPYIPNVPFDDNEERMRRRGLLWTYDRNREECEENTVKNYNRSAVVCTLALVATREICDEELFLNYRLSNHKKWPSWYLPVDVEEDKRRWY